MMMKEQIKILSKEIDEAKQKQKMKISLLPQRNIVKKIRGGGKFIVSNCLGRKSYGKRPEIHNIPKLNLPLTSRGKSRSKNPFASQHQRSTSIKSSRILNKKFKHLDVDNEVSKAAAFKVDFALKTARGRKKIDNSSTSKSVLQGIQAYKNRRQKHNSSSKSNLKASVILSQKQSNETKKFELQIADNALDNSQNHLRLINGAERHRNGLEIGIQNIDNNSTLQSKTHPNPPIPANRVLNKQSNSDTQNSNNGILTSFKKFFN